jgi:hypothetical protein
VEVHEACETRVQLVSDMYRAMQRLMVVSRCFPEREMWKRMRRVRRVCAVCEE